MKRIKLNIRRCASLIPFPKLALVFTIVFTLSLATAVNADAQRRGGGGGRSGMIRGGMERSGGIARSGISHGGFGNNHMNYGHIWSGGFGHRRYMDRDDYGYRGYPYWRYSYFPVWGDFYWDIPPYSFSFPYEGYNYYSGDGIYYRYDKDKYQVVPAPIGYRVKVLPKGSIQFVLDGVTYYYYFGSYYTPQNGQFEIVQPPVGALVESIPDGYDKVVIDGQTYYTLHGVQYKAVVKNNEIWYQVVKNNANNVASSNHSKEEQSDQNNNTDHK